MVKMIAQFLRAAKWRSVRNAHVKKFPTCAVCNGSSSIEVHHIKPVHLYPDLELNPSNLITLCEGRKSVNCHLWFGHLGDYKSYNPTVVKDAKIWQEKIKHKLTA